VCPTGKRPKCALRHIIKSDSDSNELVFSSQPHQAQQKLDTDLFIPMRCVETCRAQGPLLVNAGLSTAVTKTFSSQHGS